MRRPLQLRSDAPLTPGGYMSLVASGIGIAALLALAILGLNLATGARFASLLTNLGLWLIIAVGFQVFVGSTGTISFGHPAFVALGAYTGGILTLPPAMQRIALPDLPGWLAGLDPGLWPATIAGGAVAALLALLIGPIVMRLTGIAAGIMTFGLLVIVNEMIRAATPFTRGNATFYGVPRLAGLTEVLVVVVLVVGIALAYKFSRWGLRARSVAQDPVAAEMSGISVVTSRLWAFVLSAFICGIGGALMGFFLTAFSAQSFYVGMVLPMMIMVLLGGMNSVAGALTGAVLLTFWEYVMRLIETGGMGISLPPGLSQLTLGAGLIAILFFRPSGLWGSREFFIAPVGQTRKGDNP